MAGSGLVALVAMAIARSLDVPGLTVSFSPLAFPSIPLLPVVGILVALVPAVAAPNPLRRRRRAVARAGPDGGARADRRGAAAVDTAPSDLSGVPT